MKNNDLRFIWLTIFLLIAPVLLSLWLEVDLPISKTAHTWVETGLIFILYGLVLVWLKANEWALFLGKGEKTKSPDQIWTDHQESPGREAK